MSRGNGTLTSYGYDAVSRLTELSSGPTGTANDLTLGFAYNPAGQIVSAHPLERRLQLYRAMPIMRAPTPSTGSTKS